MSEDKKNIYIILKKIGFFLIIFILFLLLNTNKVYGAWVSSDINGINESRYPGYKSLIQSLQSKYPNWNIKLYYTGLNWDDVLNGEYKGHGESPTNLSYYTYKGEWICPICGEQTYDVSHKWYCASRKAIAYMMDPRNSLTEDWIFQFQNLGSSSGTRAEVEKMVQGTFLSNSSCVDAIMEAAQTYNISPFHLVSRIVQEQNVSGTGKMNGYIYLTDDGRFVKVFNLFNIQVSGNNAEEGFLAGAKFAYQNGWFTQEECIKGGAKFLREKYINRGQNTLYFQKYNVSDLSNLYQHQYMQNIRAANDEGNKIYKNYRDMGILSSHFEFIIPVYENMPSTVSTRPISQSSTYRGDIATEVTQLELQKNGDRSYLNGEIVVTEWIDGATWSVPKSTPRIRIKALDGSLSYEMWVCKIDGNKYYFDGYIDGIDESKNYQIEVESGSNLNVSPYRIAKGYYNAGKTLGQYRRHLISIDNSIIYFSNTYYCGDLAFQILSTKMNLNDQGRPYLAGEILITEWLNTIWTVPDVTPEIAIISTDGTSKQEFWVVNIGSNKYYFDGYIDELDMSRAYVIQVKLKNTYNYSTNQLDNIIYTSDIDLGLYREDIRIVIENSKIIFKGYLYDANIATQIENLELLKGTQGSYLKGEILITEWIDGITWSVPRKLPKMRIKEINGTDSYELWVVPISGNRYYFDGYINGINTQKEYEIEVESGSIRNISQYRVGKGYYATNKDLGKYENTTVRIENNKLIFKLDIYQGDIATQIENITLINGEKGNYIKGEILVTEWINGIVWSIPRETPKIRIKEINGTESYELWVVQMAGNKYYFDGYIDGINTNKEYVIEVESGSEENTSKYRIANGYYSKNEELGTYYNNKMKIENNILKFIHNNDSQSTLMLKNNVEATVQEDIENVEVTAQGDIIESESNCEESDDQILKPEEQVIDSLDERKDSGNDLIKTLPNKEEKTSEVEE